MIDNKHLKQGAIFLADLDPIQGSEQGGYRPVVVLQNNILNKHLSTITIAPITKNLKAKGFFTTFFLQRKLSGLDYDSIVLLFQIRTLDKSRFKKHLFTMSPMEFRELRKQLALIF